MSFIESYEAQLVEAAQRRRDARLRNRIARRVQVPRRRGAAIALAALVLAVPTAAATVGGWNPFDDPGRDPRFPAPSVSRNPVDPQLTATLGVLRRPQTEADRGAVTSRAARVFTNQYAGAVVSGIRLIDPDRQVVLVPFERTSMPRQRDGRPVPGFDPSDFRNQVCLVEPSPDGFAGLACHSADKIRAGRAVSTDGGLVSGLVPDGVARVRLIRGEAATEAAVRDNYFSVRADAPRVVEWVRGDGTLARRIDLTAPDPRP